MAMFKSSGGTSGLIHRAYLSAGYRGNVRDEIDIWDVEGPTCETFRYQLEDFRLWDPVTAAAYIDRNNGYTAVGDEGLPEGDQRWHPKHHVGLWRNVMIANVAEGDVREMFDGMNVALWWREYSTESSVNDVLEAIDAAAAQDGQHRFRFLNRLDQETTEKNHYYYTDEGFMSPAVGHNAAIRPIYWGSVPG